MQKIMRLGVFLLGCTLWSSSPQSVTATNNPPPLTPIEQVARDYKDFTGETLEGAFPIVQYINAYKEFIHRETSKTLSQLHTLCSQMGVGPNFWDEFAKVGQIALTDKNAQLIANIAQLSKAMGWAMGAYGSVGGALM